jgi:hypothetical protein
MHYCIDVVTIEWNVGQNFYLPGVSFSQSLVVSERAFKFLPCEVAAITL